MQMTRRRYLVYALLVAVWALVVFWQIEEHQRVTEYAKTSLRSRARVIANTLGAYIRGLRVRGSIFDTQLQPLLDELVGGRTNDLVQSVEVLYVAVLNAQETNNIVADAGEWVGEDNVNITNEVWLPDSFRVVYPLEGVLFLRPDRLPPRPARTNDLTTTNLVVEGVSNAPPETTTNLTESAATPSNAVAQAGRDGRPGAGAPGPRPWRPYWAWGMTQQDWESLIRQREMHGLFLSLSTAGLQARTQNDLWLRFVITFFATVSVIGSALAWGNLVKSSDLQIRLVRASELTSHLREMNLAAAGLAHETRNPLNIIRGRAQMISQQPGTPADLQEKSREIINEADKVAAQLNEFINYSRPREVRRTKVALGAVVNEVVRALSYDLEEKKIRLEIKGEQINVEADEQMLRQVLFNLLLNAIQAVDGEGGEIQVAADRRNGPTAVLEVRDNGMGVPPERRSEIFKPYFTTQKSGTGLGLAVVQQIVLAHGWEVECLGNEPKGAVFRISHLKLAA
jgi:signal transduction histidine kinase